MSSSSTAKPRTSTVTGRQLPSPIGSATPLGPPGNTHQDSKTDPPDPEDEWTAQLEIARQRASVKQYCDLADNSEEIENESSSQRDNSSCTQPGVGDIWDQFEHMFQVPGADVVNDPIEERLSVVSTEDNDSDDEDVFKLHERSAEDLPTEYENCFLYRWKLAAEALSKKCASKSCHHCIRIWET